MRLLTILSVLFLLPAYSQTITVDDTTNSPAQLVNLLLGNSCVEVSNISISSPQSVAYFNKNGSVFPINEGIIIRNGVANYSAGAYTGNNLNSQINSINDPYLQNLSNSSGQMGSITDVAFLEFDFVPLSSKFSFDFLFASNEYGQYQCGFSDVFAFVLTNLNTGVTNNLAVIPGTSTPVTVKDIRNSAYNNACASINPIFFGTYNVGNPTAALNMRGNTVIMNASSIVTPNTPYKIRLVIGDYNDANFDSAVFLAAGSFTTTLDLGPNRIICDGDEAILNTNLDNTYTYTWYRNGVVIPGANASSYTVTTFGTYKVEAVKGSCFITDTIVFSNLAVSNPIDLQTCNTGASSYVFNLSTNNESQLGINVSIYDVFYYESLADIASNTPISNPAAFSSPGAQTIYLKIFNTVTGKFCNAVYTFNLIVNNPVIATQPQPVLLCQSTGGSDTSFGLNALDPQVLNGLSASSYTVSYHLSSAEANSGSNPITNVTIPSGASTITVHIRIQDNSNSSCFDTTSVTITVNPLPIVDDIPDPTECSDFVVPILTNGTVFSGPNGTGTQYNPGDIIDSQGTYYIFVGPDANGCTNQSSFFITMIDEFVPKRDNCGSFVVPIPPKNVGAFYTAPGGPSGSGTLIPSGTVFTNTGSTSITQNIYYYAEVNGVFCRDQLFTIYIHPVPLVDQISDVVTCDSFVLPPLIHGSYNTMADGTGLTLNPGDIISVHGPNFPGTYYVFNSAPHITSQGQPRSCKANDPFVVSLVDTSQFTAISRCGSYTLPAISFGGYFSAPFGGGLSIDPAIPITTSQVVYYFANTTTLPNCTNNLNFNITINPLPVMDPNPSGTYCGEFSLPVLSNGGVYYKLSGGPSVLGQTQLIPGQLIDLTGTNLSPGTYYMFYGPDINGCSTEQAFTININPFPPTDGVLDRFECSPYSIPTPVHGQIYTAPGGPSGGGTLVNSSQVFNNTNTFYIYNINPVTLCKRDLPFTINYVGINLPNYSDINVCEFENYVLPPLTHIAPSPDNYSIGYFYDQAGTIPVPNGTIFNTPNTVTKIWVVAKNGDRITCTARDSFDIIVSKTPDLSALGLVFDNEECGTYALPALPTVPYNIGYFSQPGGVGPITNFNVVNTTGSPETYTYYVYASATNNTNCNDEISFTFTVYPLLNIVLQDGFICVDPATNNTLRTYTISTGLNPAIYTVNWYLNGVLMGTGPNYIASQVGTYDVKFIKLTPDIGADCNYRDTTVTVFASGPASAGYEVSNAFEWNTFISVVINSGFGQYVYQLEYPDGTFGEIQTSNLFTNLETGIYNVHIYDILAGCSPSFVGPIHIINYPNYFTPNGDGYNDYWNITDFKHQPGAVINIFDRYGKLIKQMSPASIGWDGKLNGKDLPSTDYWFTIEYTTPKNEKAIFKAHFSLKR